MLEDKSEKLKRFNLIMGGFHLIQGILMIFLATTVIQKISEFQPTIVQFYQQFNPITKTLEVTSRKLFDLYNMSG